MTEVDQPQKKFCFLDILFVVTVEKVLIVIRIFMKVGKRSEYVIN